MEPPFRLESRSSGGLALVGVALGVPLSAWLDHRLLAGYLTVLCGAGAALAVRGWLGAPLPVQAVAGIGAAVFAPAALQYGERGVLWAAAGALLLMAVEAVLAGPVRHLLDLVATALAVVIAAGFLGAYLVLIPLSAGNSALVAAVVMLAAYTMVLNLDGPFGKVPGGSAGPAVGACTVGGTIALMLGGTPLGAVSSLVLSAAAGLCAALGAWVAIGVLGPVDASEQPAEVEATQLLQPVLAAAVAVPVFFYGLMLYLR